MGISIASSRDFIVSNVFQLETNLPDEQVTKNLLNKHIKVKNS